MQWPAAVYPRLCKKSLNDHLESSRVLITDASINNYLPQSDCLLMGRAVPDPAFFERSGMTRKPLKFVICAAPIQFLSSVRRTFWIYLPISTIFQGWSTFANNTSNCACVYSQISVSRLLNYSSIVIKLNLVSGGLNRFPQLIKCGPSISD